MSIRYNNPYVEQLRNKPYVNHTESWIDAIKVHAPAVEGSATIPGAPIDYAHPPMSYRAGGPAGHALDHRPSKHPDQHFPDVLSAIKRAHTLSRLQGSPIAVRFQQRTISVDEISYSRLVDSFTRQIDPPAQVSRKVPRAFSTWDDYHKFEVVADGAPVQLGFLRGRHLHIAGAADVNWALASILDAPNFNNPEIESFFNGPIILSSFRATGNERLDPSQQWNHLASIKLTPPMFAAVLDRDFERGGVSAARGGIWWDPQKWGITVDDFMDDADFDLPWSAGDNKPTEEGNPALAEAFSAAVRN
jgi:hypothetical protein